MPNDEHYFEHFSPGDPIVAMVIWKDTPLVATAHHVYRLTNGKFEPIKFTKLPDKTESV